MLWAAMSVSAQNATVTEKETVMGTYAYSDPDPVPHPESSIYPYFRFGGFAVDKKDKAWKTVVLENPYIKVTLFPEIGGKIWGATDKASGRDFLYSNDVVKFRDIAMRGAWVSGGVEFNFGIIGHAPTSATPIDYLTKEKSDGSVSCFISAIELLTRTTWMIEVNLPKDKAYFTTHTTWYNSSDLDQPYYQWMNAAYSAKGDIQFCYPGTNYIGHDGSLHSFPKDEEGRDISWYKNNAFDGSKSFHVLGKYNDFYGAYWHDYDFGSVHHSDYNAKLGQKIFLWSLARDGGIWEDLLTDKKGQYVELQSGRQYNQPVNESAYTPFKHAAFSPGRTDSWTEYWYPIKGTKGVAKASNIGALNVIRDNGQLLLSFSPTEKLNTAIKLFASGKEILNEPLSTEVLKTWNKSIPLTSEMAEGKLKVVIGDDALVYSEVAADNVINRPKTSPADFDWNSLYGLYVKGSQFMNQRMYARADTALRAAVEKDKYFAPAVNRLASLCIHLGNYNEALELCRRSMSIDAYDSEANYLYGLCNEKLGHFTDAKDGFSVASRDEEFRTAAYAHLAGLSIRDADWNKAETYAKESLKSNSDNIEALHEMLVIARKTSQKSSIDVSRFPLNHLLRYEKYIANPTDATRKDFASLIRSELPDETYLELSCRYESLGLLGEAADVLTFAPNNAIATYRQAWLLHLQGKEDAAKELVKKADNMKTELQFAYRPENLQAMIWAKSVTSSWKPFYFEAQICNANLNKEKAVELLENCTNADYSPFFLYRASLKKGAAKLADLNRAASLKNSWRAGNALIDYYSSEKQWNQAYQTAAKYYKLYPDNFVIDLQYATALCETHRFAQCVSMLRNIWVLPNEGASYGREIYRRAYLSQAIDLLLKGSGKKATSMIEYSKHWPENLGVGKPFDTNINLSTENFLQSLTTLPTAQAREKLQSSDIPLIKHYFDK